MHDVTRSKRCNHLSRRCIEASKTHSLLGCWPIWHRTNVDRHCGLWLFTFFLWERLSHQPFPDEPMIYLYFNKQTKLNSINLAQVESDRNEKLQLIMPFFRMTMGLFWFEILTMPFKPLFRTWIAFVPVVMIRYYYIWTHLFSKTISRFYQNSRDKWAHTCQHVDVRVYVNIRLL